MEQQSLLPPKDANRSYPIAYKGTCCDTAIRADNAAMLRECVERDFIDASSEMLDGKTVLQFCMQEVPTPVMAPDGRPISIMKPRAPRCAEMLRKLGWSVPASKAEAFGIR